MECDAAQPRPAGARAGGQAPLVEIGRIVEHRGNSLPLPRCPLTPAADRRATRRHPSPPCPARLPAPAGRGGHRVRPPPPVQPPPPTPPPHPLGAEPAGAGVPRRRRASTPVP